MVWMKKGVCAAGLALLICLFLFPAHVVAEAQDDSLFITKDGLKAVLGNADITLIDLRFGRDWTDATLKIKGAIHEDPMKPGQWIDKYAKDRLLVFYGTGPKDATSTSLVRMLKAKGYAKVLALRGGFSEWLAANYPTEPK